jgi:hypothetical protein
VSCVKLVRLEDEAIANAEILYLKYDKYSFNKVMPLVYSKAAFELGFEKTVVVRPALLLGERKESRPGERIGQLLFRNLNFLFPKSIKAVSAESVASTLVRALFSKKNGICIIENQEIHS